MAPHHLNIVEKQLWRKLCININIYFKSPKASTFHVSSKKLLIPSPKVQIQKESKQCE